MVMPPSVGVVGLGAMGLHLARRLARRVPLTHVFDTNPAAVSAAVGGGCVAANDAAAAVNHQMVLTSLPRSSDVNRLALDALEAGTVQPGLIWVDMTSGHPDESRATAAALKESGAWFLDAGVAGGPRGAEAGTLTCMVGGEAEQIAAATPLMKALAAKIVHVGAPSLCCVVLSQPHTVSLSCACHRTWRRPCRCRPCRQGRQQHAAGLAHRCSCRGADCPC